MIRKSVKRTASLGDLDWQDFGTEAQAKLPYIPDITYPYQPNIVVVGPAGVLLGEFGDEFVVPADEDIVNIDDILGLADDQAYGFIIRLGYTGIALSNSELNVPFASSLGEGINNVEGMDPDFIARKFLEKGIPAMPDIASRKGHRTRYVSKRAASMSLDWIQDGDQLYAELPPIPGYSTPDNPAIACIYRDLAGYWMLDIVIGDGDYVLDEAVFGDHASYSVQEWKDYVASLTPEEIAALFDEWTEESVDASRHACKRKADLGGLDWVENAPDKSGAVTYTADIPGTLYQVDVMEWFPDDWGFMIRKKDGRFMIVDQSAFDIHMASTAEEMMNEVEHLSAVDISRVCDEHRYD